MEFALARFVAGEAVEIEATLVQLLAMHVPSTPAEGYAASVH